MGHKRALLSMVLCISSLLLRICQASDFNSTFGVTWGGENVFVNASTGTVGVSLNSAGKGSTVTSLNTYLFGSFKSQIKLVPGNSAGTVSAFFLSSPLSDPQHDEIDFEFLGNVSGQPYKLQSNLFANGTGGREEQMYLWFDPTTDFHTYEVLWNHKLIMWLVDDIPVRVYHNVQDIAPLSFPTFRPLTVTTCIFDASDWATQGGGVHTNYSAAPFTITLKDFAMDACVAEGDNVGSCADSYSGNWWEGTRYQTFNSDWANQMAWVREYHLKYNYCSDSARYPTPPVECSYNHAL